MNSALLIACVLLVSACTTTANTPGTVHVQLSADPPTVRGDSGTTLYIDVTNTGVKTVGHVNVLVFDTGALTNTDCIDEMPLGNLNPGELAIKSCALGSADIPSSYGTANVNVKTTYDANFDILQDLSFITNTEYRTQRATNTFKAKPRSYSYSDGNIRVDVEFSTDLPIVLPDKKDTAQIAFVTMTITNVGNGLIQIRNIVFTSSPEDVVACDIPKHLETIGKTFPRIVCPIYAPEDIAYLRDISPTIYIGYTYDIRETLPISIIG